MGEIMSSKAKISILIPAYKADRFIKECLDSIEAQTYFEDYMDYEILIGIDGCEDTLNKVKAIRGNYRNIKVYMMERNMGVYITLNTLLTLAKNSIFIKFDADDVMRDNMVEKISESINEFDIVRYYCQKFKFSFENKLDILLPDGSLAFKKSVIEKIGGFKPWVCGADTDFLNRAKNVCSVKNIIEVLFYYRNHEESLTHDPRTGKDSQIRQGYIKQMSKSFEYVQPVTNSFFKVN